MNQVDLAKIRNKWSSWFKGDSNTAHRKNLENSLLVEDMPLLMKEVDDKLDLGVTLYEMTLETQKYLGIIDDKDSREYAEALGFVKALTKIRNMISDD